MATPFRWRGGGGWAKMLEAAKLARLAAANLCADLSNSNTTLRKHDQYRLGINVYLSTLRPRKNRDHAYRRLPVVLRMRELQNSTQAQARRLLRLLLVR